MRYLTGVTFLVALVALVALMALMALTACDGGQQQSAGTTAAVGAPVVMTVNYPLAYFAERIGGPLVQVGYPVPAGIDPAFWSPTAQDVAVFQEADLIILNGADYAKWVPRVTLPRGRMVNTSLGFAEHLIHVEDTATHSHGPGGEHAHTGTAFTTWLDFTQAAAQARSIRDAFAQRWPEHIEAFNSGFATLEQDLLALDTQLAGLTAGHGERPLIASHPVYQYLARRHDLNLRAVEWEPESPPNLRQWTELRDLLADHPARWMIWEGEPAAESVRRLEELGITSVVFAPCMNRPADGDFMTVMRANVASLAPVFE